MWQIINNFESTKFLAVFRYFQDVILGFVTKERADVGCPEVHLQLHLLWVPDILSIYQDHWLSSTELQVRGSGITTVNCLALSGHGAISRSLTMSATSYFFNHGCHLASFQLVIRMGIGVLS